MAKEIKKIILTRGIPGSVKSTWAKAWVAESPETRIRLNWDDMRNMLGPYWVPSRENINKTMLWCAVNTAAYCDKPYDIVIDNMNLNPKGWKEVEEWIETYNASSHATSMNVQYVLEFKDFFTPVEECIRRDAMHTNPIGEKTIKDIWRKYRHFIQTQAVERYVNNLRPRDPNKPDCIVVDMDSTMCFNTNGRPWYGEGSTEAMINDIPNEGVVNLVKSQSYPIVVCTGRNRAQAEVTEKWLNKYGVYPEVMHFRTDNDYRTGVIVKSELMENILKDYNVVAVFEDCEPIVAKFREMGLTVLQPNKGI